MPEYLLRILNLKVYYCTLDGVIKAVDDVSFDINRGEIFGLVGESGCGKSTIGLAIPRLLPLNAIVNGSILFCDLDLLKLSEEEMRKIRGKEISIIFQDPSATLNPLLTVGDHLSDILKTHSNVKEDKKIKEIVLELLKEVALPDPERIYNMFPHELSGGMQQRVAIAAALSTKPKLLIADEPTTMLDVSIQSQILDLISELREKLNLSILFITHNLGIAAEICDRLAVMYAGTIVEEGYVEQIFERPLHPYTQGLLKAVPKITKEKYRLTPIPGNVPSLIDPPIGCRFHTRCQYVLSKCKMEPVRLIEVEPCHKVACHQYFKNQK